jgi:hypothetical protein
LTFARKQRPQCVLRRFPTPNIALQQTTLRARTGRKQVQQKPGRGPFRLLAKLM